VKPIGSTRELKPVEATKPGNPAIRTARILVMEEDDMLRDIVGEILLRLGYDVELARDGIEAINLYISAINSGKPFDAVILDLTVARGMGGKETVNRLLELDSQVKAIVSSGYFDDPEMIAFNKYGFAGALPKPYTIASLSDVLDEVLKSRKEFVERRKHKRFKVKSGAIVSIIREAIAKSEQTNDMSRGDNSQAATMDQCAQMGQIINISKSGLALRYIDSEEEPNEPFELDILFAQDSFYLRDVPAKTVWVFDAVSKFGRLKSKLCGMQFGQMHPIQKLLLESFLNKYTYT